MCNFEDFEVLGEITYWDRDLNVSVAYLPTS